MDCIIIQKTCSWQVPWAIYEFSIVDIVKVDGEHITVKSDTLPDCCSMPGRSFAVGDKATLGLRPQYLSIVDAS